MGERLRTGVRQSDTIARVGGDEFVALIPHIDRPALADGLARKLLDSLACPLVVRGHLLTVLASIGIAMFGDTLLDHADKAMYQAKLQGGNRYQHFERSMTREHASHALGGPH
ncbi:MAG: GGDEF domain-containing protein [Duganella sp.]